MNYKFSENEVPFGILQRYGLTQEMVEDLPLDVLQNIYDGKRSPVLPVQMTADDGEIVKDRTRFSLVRKNDGTVDVLFYPIREEIDLKNLNDAQRQRLEANKPIIATAMKERLRPNEARSVSSSLTQRICRYFLSLRLSLAVTSST